MKWNEERRWKKRGRKKERGRSREKDKELVKGRVWKVNDGKWTVKIQ